MKKQWYIYTEGYTDCTHKQLVQYTSTKADADKLFKQVLKINKISWVDFVAESNLNLPFSKIHGENIDKVESIMEIINPPKKTKNMTYNQVLEVIREKSSLDSPEEQQKQIKALNLSDHLTHLISGYCALCNQEIIFHCNKEPEKEICLRWIKELIA